MVAHPYEMCQFLHLRGKHKPERWFTPLGCCCYGIQSNHWTDTSLHL